MPKFRFLFGPSRWILSPERERKLAWFAKKDDRKKKAVPAGFEQRESGLVLPAQERGFAIEDARALTKGRTLSVVPEALPGMEELRENARVLMDRLAKDGNDDLARAREEAEKNTAATHEGGPLPEEILTTFLRDPRGTLLLAEAVGAEIQWYDDLAASAERKMKTVFRDLPPGEHPLMRFEAAVKGETVDRARVEHILDLPALGPDGEPQEHVAREDLVRLILEALNAYRKSRSAGLMAKRTESPDPDAERQAQNLWHTEYRRKLGRNLETLKEHLGAQVQQTVLTFLEADTARERALHQGLNLPAETAGKSPVEQKRILGQAALAAYGVPYAAIREEFEDRAAAAIGYGMRTQEERARLLTMEPEEVTRLLPAARDPDFLTGAKTILENIQTMEDESDRFDRESAHFLAEIKAEQEDVQDWACDTGKALREIDDLPAEARQKLQAAFGAPGAAMSLPDVAAHLQRYGATDGSRDALARAWREDDDRGLVRLFFERRDAVDAALSLVEHPEALARTDMKRALAALNADESHPENVEIIRQGLRMELDALLGRIVPLVRHPICDELGVTEKLRSRIEELKGRTYGIGQIVDGKPLEKAEVLHWEIGRLQELESFLAAHTIDRAVEEDFANTKEDGFYDYADRKIHLRRGLSDERKQAVFRHERGHAILHALRHSGIAPLFFLSSHQSRLLRHAGGCTLAELLEDGNLRREYHIDACEAHFRAFAEKHFPGNAAAIERHVRQLRQEYLLEEALSRYVSWEEGGRQEIAPGDRTPAAETEREIFAIFDDGRPPREPAGIRGATEGLDITLYQGEGEGAGSMGGERETASVGIERTAEGAAQEETPNIRQQLINVRRSMYVISSFVKAYEDTDDMDLRNFLEQEVKLIYSVLEKEYDRCNKIAFGQDPTVPQPETDRHFLMDLQNLSKDVDALQRKIRTRDRELLDISGKARRVKPIGFWDTVQFVSVLDLVKLWKDTMEDIKTIYNRNQQRTLQTLGNTVNDILSDTGGKLPFVGKRYLSKLRGYHERRYAGAELESVDKWKKAMEKLDSHQLLDILGTARNLDQIRGIIEMLCDRGEMDWDNKDIWKTLMDISGYQMPVKACQRDDILRDMWLRRIISVIWKDKELYYKWRTNNDSNTNSHKQKFISQVDQFSNVRGGLAGSLEGQLLLFTRWQDLKEEAQKQGLPHPPFPDEVKPHLYEQIIEYSIKNGKMSMEQKMFYLVKGIAVGLLPIERLRALAGQNGGIINFFPFIEYFYQKNNSLPEIRKIADELTEKATDADPRAPFHPGIKTTLWLHYQVAREEAVRARLSKGSTRIAENIDHEDIPFLVTQMDWNEMRNMADVISGGRQKVTPEGWKNAYVGFNSKFKILGCLAKMDERHLARFTPADARMLAQNLGAFVYMDNALTQNGIPEKERAPTLTEYQFKTESPSGVSGVVTSEYRDRMIEFLQSLHSAGFFNHMNWSNIGVTQEQMLPFAKNTFRRNPKEVAKKVLDAEVFTKFISELERVTKQHPDLFKQVLASKESEFLNEGGSEKLKYETVEQIQLEALHRSETVRQ